MNGAAPDEYDLADAPEPDRPDSEPPPPPKPSAPRVPGQPLPRMWKSEPDDAPVRPAASPKPRAAEPPPPPSRRGAPVADGGTTRKTGLKPKPDPNEKGEKKVLIEDTPVFDTYETRQRVRLATGGMLVFVVGLAVYIVYSVFLYDPFPMDDLPPEDGYVVEAAPPASKPDLDFEARAMLSRARESARNGRTDEAIALLEQLKKAYPKTRTATEAQEALERPSQNLPLFLDGPTVKADAPAPQPPAAPEPPPAVVDARPPNAQVGGDARLAPPVNPAETLVAPPVSGEVAVQPASPGEVPDRRLPPGFAARPEAGVDPSGWPLAIVGDRDGATMVFVPGGVFLMGEERDPQFASPEHKVRLGAYYIDRHEVTVGQFRRFLSETRYGGNWAAIDEKDEAKAKSTEAMPMVLVSQADAMAFAEWAGKALPTEAQWEAAARTTDGRLFPWGDEPPNYSKKRVPRQVDAVMSFPEDRSPYDVFDLAGNVLEWTADAFDRNYYRSLAGRVVDDPAGATPPRTGRYDVVVKGGKLGAASSREPIAPGKRLPYVGFRCAVQVERLAPAPEIAAPAPAPASAPTSSPSRPDSNPTSPATKSALPVVPF